MISVTKHVFKKYAHISGARGSPDMIFNEFYMKFADNKKEIPPRACRTQETKTHNVQDLGRQQKKQHDQCAGYGPQKGQKPMTCRIWSPKQSKKECSGYDPKKYKSIYHILTEIFTIDVQRHIINIYHLSTYLPIS